MAAQSSTQYASLVLHEAPTQKSRQLAIHIMKKVGLSGEEAQARLQTLPCVIIDRLNVAKCEKVAEYMRDHDAVVAVKHLNTPSWVADSTPSPEPQQAQPESAPPQAPQPEQSQNYTLYEEENNSPGFLRKLFRVALVSTALIMAGLFAVLKFYPELIVQHLPVQQRMAQSAPNTPMAVPVPQRPAGAQQKIEKYEPKGLRPLQWRYINIKSVPFEQQPQFWKDALLLDPDRRLANVFSALMNVYMALLSSDAERNSELLYDANHIVVRLKSGDDELAEVELPYDATFGDWLAAYEQWMDALDQHIGALPVGSAPADNALVQADSWLGEGDPRALFLALTELNREYRANGLHPALLRRAARGYALLVLGMRSDPMDRLSAMATKGVSFLAMAQHLTPEEQQRSTTRAEGLMALGYAAHAQKQGAILAKQGPAPKNNAEKLLDAALRRDFGVLQGAAWDANQITSSSLSPLLYMDYLNQSGEDDSIEAYLAQAKQYMPLALPDLKYIAGKDSLSGRLQLTGMVLQYLGHITKNPNTDKAWLQQEFHPASNSKSKKFGFLSFWLKLNKNGSDIPDMQSFSKQLQAWDPLAGGQESLIFTAGDGRGIVQSYYDYTLYRLFLTHVRSRGVAREGLQILDEFASGMESNPMVFTMNASIQGSTAKYTQSTSMALALLQSARCTPFLASQMQYFISSSSNVPSRPLFAQVFDSRPDILKTWAKLISLESKKHSVQAMQRALRYNPYNPDGLVFLAQAKGDETLLRNALTNLNGWGPAAGALMRQAGAYYAEPGSAIGDDHAMACYRQALRYHPNDWDLMRYTLRIMKRRGMWDEAVQLYTEHMGQRMQQNNMDGYLTRCTLGLLYNEHGEPEKAYQLVGDGVDSYIGGVLQVTADALARMGQQERSDEIYTRAIKRYPTGDHYYQFFLESMLRHGRINDAAAFAIKQASKRRTAPHRWLPEAINQIAKELPPEQAVERIGAFSQKIHAGQGIPAWCSQAVVEKLLGDNRPEVAFAFVQHAAFPGQMSFIGQQLRYMALAAHPDYGEDAAMDDLLKSASGKQYIRVAVGLMEKQEYAPVLYEKFPSFDPQPDHQSYMYLLQTICWLANGREPATMEEPIRQGLDSMPADIYKTAVLHLLEEASAEDVLAFAKDNKSRGEVSYYLGLASRLGGDFDTASAWYNVGMLYDQGDSNLEHLFMKAESDLWQEIGLDQFRPAPVEERKLFRQMQQGQTYDPTLLPFEQKPRRRRDNTPSST